jgi:hypothetical protein
VVEGVQRMREGQAVRDAVSRIDAGAGEPAA